MVPTPQELSAETRAAPAPALTAERVVISGMSGLFPKSRNVKEFSDNLYNKINVITKTSRWSYNHPEVSPYTGNVPGLEKFDAQFFKVHYRLGNSMDSMSRKVLEQAYQAIYDAGVSPEYLNGRKVSVYMGSCFSETEKACFYVASSRTGFGIAGCNKAMFANRISYWLNAKGPSMNVDQACCSSIVALEKAYQDITRGECEAAIVAGANLSLHPHSSVHYARILNLSMDGKTKSFDENADGCAKSEAINVLFLQRAKDAKRVYAEVVYVKSEFTEIVMGETGPRFGFYRDPINMTEFIKQFYKEVDVAPEAVEFVEAFGSAIPEVDKAELEALANVYCKEREESLFVGSVMSNIGYSEAASGISAITKVVLGYHKGEISSNMHCENPRRDVAALRDGRMRILTDHQPFSRGYTAVNGISATGCNAHVLLHGNYKPKDLNRYKSSIPHLVTISARMDTAVQNVLSDLKSRPIDPEEIALFHNIHSSRISGHLGRGYVILKTDENNKTISLAETASYFDDAKRPLWFVYSGMGSQWAGMGIELMRIPIFAAAIERCRKVLEPKGVDIIHILTSPDKSIFDNILNSFVGIAAVQIGLTDVLTSLGVVPDKIIGHSVGELGCAYADGCFTAEEMILSAYSRGLVSVQTPFIRGSMAAVGIGYEQVKEIVPREIEVACHNGPESSTISGPADVMREFVIKLSEKGIFAKEVPCSNIAYHSRYIAEAGPGLLKYLTDVIKNPKPRSERWVSTSVPKERWHEPSATTSSAEYHTNNLLNPVLFEETSRLIPGDAVLIEIAPHGLLQAILKRSLPVSCRHIPLTRRGHPDNAFLVLDGIGKLFMQGYYPKVEALYPKVEFPVSTGTPMLSHLVEWAHNETWQLPLYASAHRKQAAACKFIVSIHDDEHKYLRGHVIRDGGRAPGQIVYPFAAALVAVWDTLAMSLQLPRRLTTVEFTDVQLLAPPPLHDSRQLRLSVAVHRGTGRFEVLDEDRKIITGFIGVVKQDATRHFDLPFETNEGMSLDSKGVYQLLHERDYFYQDEFRSIHRVNPSLTEGQIVWNDNWVTFLDGVLQMSMLRRQHECVSQPHEIRRIRIDVDRHFSGVTENVDDKTVMKAQVLEMGEIIRCGGVLIEKIELKNLPKLREDAVALKVLKFVPRFQSAIDAASALQIHLQTVSENTNKDTLNFLGIVNYKDDVTTFNEIRNVLDDVFGVKVQYEQMERNKILEMRDYFLTKVDVILVQDLSSDDSLCQMLYRILPCNMFIINGEEAGEDRVRPSALYRVVSALNAARTKLELVRWRPTPAPAASTVATARTRSDLTLLEDTRAALPPRHKLVVLSSYPPVPGLKDLVTRWRREPDRNHVYLVMVSDRDHLDELPGLDVAFNVLRDGVWGGDYYTPWQETVTMDKGMTLRSGRIGDLESLHWVEAPEPSGPGVLVNVHYAAINDIDVKRATGVIQLQDEHEIETSYGADFSGTTDSGKRVMGIVSSGAASGRILARPELLWPVPDHWSMEDAATVPFAYALAFYCLALKVNLRRGLRVLVHGGAGALGQAVISIALANGCEVFTTVSDVRKKRFLLRLFPDLKGDHIGNSRDSSFGDMVRLIMKGKGCELVISCVKGELKRVSLKSCAQCGIMLDLTQIPNREKYYFGLANLDQEKNYVPVDIFSIFKHEKVEEMKRIQLLMCEGISRGYVRPLSRVTYAPGDAPRAFRLLAGSRHRGRALLRLHPAQSLAAPRLSCSPDLCHLVLCNEGGFGLQLADRLVYRGARKLLLHFVTAPSHLPLKIQSWEKLGVEVRVSTEDLSSNKGIVCLLSESSRLGAVEGAYVAATHVCDSVTDAVAALVANLDLASRKLCPSIKYFAVVSAGITIGQQTSLSRVRDGLPVTVVNLPTLKKLDDITSTREQKELMSWRDAIDATERAIRSSQPVLMAHLRKSSQPTLLQEIALIADIDISEDILDDVTLLDLGIELARVPAIASFLNDVHNVPLDENVIPTLTIQQIRELEITFKGSKLKEVKGLETYFSYVDADELMATTEMVFLSTLTNNTSTRYEEFDVTQTYLCIIPGLEGHHNRFQILCERLKLPALVLQPGLDHINETLKQTAERYAKYLLKKVQLKDNFYLLGYESGVIVALEVANILEEHGLTGTVFCVGESPEEYQESLEKQLREFDTEEDLQEAVARHMFSLMTGSTEGLDEALQRASSFKEKIEACVRMMLGRVAHSAQYARALIEVAYLRIRQAREYKAEPRPLRSLVLLLHAALEGFEGIGRDRAQAQMQRHSVQPVHIEELCLPLVHATSDLRCAAIINRHLSPEMLNAFDQINLCETYLLNADLFMTYVAEEHNLE